MVDPSILMSQSAMRAIRYREGFTSLGQGVAKKSQSAMRAIRYRAAAEKNLSAAEASRNPLCVQ